MSPARPVSLIGYGHDKARVAIGAVEIAIE